jgi:hypothetical protein
MVKSGMVMLIGREKPDIDGLYPVCYSLLLKL